MSLVDVDSPVKADSVKFGLGQRVKVLGTYELVLLTQAAKQHVKLPCYYKSGVLLHIRQVDRDLVLEFFEGKEAKEAENVVDRVQTSERLFAHEVSYFYQGFCFQVLKLTVLLKKLSILKQICGQCLLTPDSSCKLLNLCLILIGHQWILCQL